MASFSGALTKVFPEVNFLLGGLALKGGTIQIGERDPKAGTLVQGTGAAQDTSIDIPAGSVVERVILDVETAEATGTTTTVDVGVSGGTVDAYAADLDVSATGLKVSEPAAAVDADTTVAVHADSADFADLDATLIVEYRAVL